MTTYVVLFRGINVGGARKLRMNDLRDVCMSLGWEQPQTYIQSGNLIVDAPAPDEQVRDLLVRELCRRLDWTPEIILRARPAWHGYVMSNPFADPPANPRALHLCVSREPAAPEAAGVLQPRATGGERVALAGGALWIDFGVPGVHASRLTPALIDRACGSPTTARNWNTVLAIHNMLAARVGGSTGAHPGA